MSDTKPTSLRDYFAANAPETIPNWFRPNMEHLKNPPEPHASYDPATGTVPEELLKHREEVAEVERQREAFRYFAWRWHYADQMIEARAQESWIGAL